MEMKKYDAWLKINMRKILIGSIITEHFFAVLYFIAGEEPMKPRVITYLLAIISCCLIFILIHIGCCLISGLKFAAAQRGINFISTLVLLLLWATLTVLFIGIRTGYIYIAKTGVLSAALSLMYSGEKTKKRKERKK